MAIDADLSIFPAYAGLNLLSYAVFLIFLYIPRIRGVEPATHRLYAVPAQYSPHTRG